MACFWLHVVPTFKVVQSEYLFCKSFPKSFWIGSIHCLTKTWFVFGRCSPDETNCWKVIKDQKSRSCSAFMSVKNQLVPPFVSFDSLASIDNDAVEDNWLISRDYKYFPRRLQFQKCSTPSCDEKLTKLFLKYFWLGRDWRPDPVLRPWIASLACFLAALIGFISGTVVGSPGLGATSGAGPGG